MSCEIPRIGINGHNRYYIRGGSGIILRSLGSSEGLDILSIILLKRFSICQGFSILAFMGNA
jgi:hypothetical protein